MMDLRQLGTLQLDGLREVANIGAGHAATALSELTNRRILVNVPEIRVLPLEDIPEIVGSADEVVAGVLLQVLGDVTGRTVLIFPERTVVSLTNILLNRGDVRFPDDFGDMEQSALREVGNILAGAYLNALSDFLGMLLLPSVPGLHVDLAGAILTTSYLNFVQDAEFVFCIDTIFQMDDREEELRGHFLLLPDPDSLRVILQAIRLV